MGYGQTVAGYNGSGTTDSALGYAHNVPLIGGQAAINVFGRRGTPSDPVFVGYSNREFIKQFRRSRYGRFLHAPFSSELRRILFLIRTVEDCRKVKTYTRECVAWSGAFFQADEDPKPILKEIGLVSSLSQMVALI